MECIGRVLRSKIRMARLFFSPKISGGSIGLQCKITDCCIFRDSQTQINIYWYIIFTGFQPFFTRFSTYFPTMGIISTCCIISGRKDIKYYLLGLGFSRIHNILYPSELFTQYLVFGLALCKQIVYSKWD